MPCAPDDPDRKEFAHLRYAPFILEMSELFHKWGDLRRDGYIQGKQVISRRLSGTGVDTKFLLLPDDAEVIADDADSTRVVLRVTDEFGAVRPFANDAIKLEIEGPAEIIGDNPFSLVGGTGAVWIRAQKNQGPCISKLSIHRWEHSRRKSRLSPALTNPCSVIRFANAKRQESERITTGNRDVGPP